MTKETSATEVPKDDFAIVWQMLKQLYGKDLKAASLTVFLANATGGTLINHFYPETKGGTPC
ncbi:hypothetical protein UFOVP275_4 [uncultured Caudovirales phage]|uniref:Uncharacterized protein n=1 Tax=uncultured Caudovirales phage TaxID=2100421 RepID=A0A6J5LJF3_9CAUD|nr:hypothetical protein UFOVP275_4 [uncultured Caudovirales phage]